MRTSGGGNKGWKRTAGCRLASAESEPIVRKTGTLEDQVSETLAYTVSEMEGLEAIVQGRGASQSHELAHEVALTNSSHELALGYARPAHEMRPGAFNTPRFRVSGFVRV